MCKTTATVASKAAAVPASASAVSTEDTTITSMKHTTNNKSYHGPLGPTWQPIYDTTYSILMLTFNLPHLSFITVMTIGYYSQLYRGVLYITPSMIVVCVFGMARVPFVGVGMSLCLHRYFSHCSFKTSRIVQFVLALIGSMSLQGGILWWCSKHNRHHKHCDTPLDPHSPTQTSNMYAWLGWLYYETHHDWIFVPQKYLLYPELLVVNLLFVFPNAIVTYLLSTCIGIEWALFTCWVPGLFGALATTHFNVDYHPPPTSTVDASQRQCYGINKASGDKGIGPIRLDYVAKIAPWLFEPLVGEAYHDDHHAYPKRTHRPGYDMPYTLILRPLHKMGIIWDLQQPLPTDNDFDSIDVGGNTTTTKKKKSYPIVGDQSRTSSGNNNKHE